MTKMDETYSKTSIIDQCKHEFFKGTHLIAKHQNVFFPELIFWKNSCTLVDEQNMFSRHGQADNICATLNTCKTSHTDAPLSHTWMCIIWKCLIQTSYIHTPHS